MRVVQSAGHLAVALLALTPTISAVSFASWLPDVNTLIVRQDDASQSSPEPTPTPSPSNSRDDDEPSSSVTTTKSRARTTNLNTGGLSQPPETSGTHTGKKTNRPTATTRKAYDPRDPAGGVVMQTPDVYAGSQYYKIRDYITWGWNYTNLQGTPTAIDVLVSCQALSQTWTLTQNMTFATPGSYTWDTEDFQKKSVATPLGTQEYNLVIHDSDASISDAPEPGYLATFSSFRFVMYEPKEYKDLDEWDCVSCSSAPGDVDKRALGGAIMMSLVTVLSFTWFVGGFAGLF